jgi:hypothetical protein
VDECHCVLLGNMSPVGIGINNRCVGEGQQLITVLDWTVYPPIFARQPLKNMFARQQRIVGGFVSYAVMSHQRKVGD